ncbi:MAG: phosphate signaling complex protein PhoU [Oscillospiraceae bacterium]
MRNRFDKELEQLNNNLTMMGSLCENSISMAIKAFLDGEENYAKKAIEMENQIDEMEKEIENQCLKLLLQQQPVAKDLRIISSALKMITDIERIGDQSRDIAEITKYTTAQKQISPHIKKMAEEVVKMVTDAIESFVKRDLNLAQSVIFYDDVIDGFFNTVKSDIIDIIKNDNTDGETIIDILMIAKYLERIGDHATNIAEWVVFSITGKHEEE